MSNLSKAAAASAVAGGLALLLHKLRAKSRLQRVVITGGCGNLGTKLATHLLATGKYEVVLLEHPDYFMQERVPTGASVVLGDLADSAGEWKFALHGADALVHFSAVNPYPNASWAESAGSMSHSCNVFVAAAQQRVRRVVFASSNHVMGGYKDLPDFGLVHPSSPPIVGTFLRSPEDLAKSGNAVAYAAAKLAGERLCGALAAASRATTFAILRIGWCQPGANLPSTLSAAGCPPEFQSEGGDAGGAPPAADASVDERWFKTMWLSNRDFLRYFSAALEVDIAPGAPMLVNAMSANTGSRWSLAETEAALGVPAFDDSSK